VEESMEYIEEYGRVPVGTCVTMKAGELQCKHILNAVCPTYVKFGKEKTEELI